jgi:cellobionic acid phosphorylase
LLRELDVQLPEYDEVRTESSDLSDLRPAEYRADLGGIVASRVTPYQKVADYFKNKNFKDKTFFIADQIPVAWEASQKAFEGEGGLHYPTGVQQTVLSKGDALYETPAAILQYRLALAPRQTGDFRFLFGPAFDEKEIIGLRDKYLSTEGARQAAVDYARYIAKGKGILRIETPDAELDNFVNHWLPRQLYYHGDVNRLTTDPQTRNYLQDNMGMSYIAPEVARSAFLRALGQQESSGAMPLELAAQPPARVLRIVVVQDPCRNLLFVNPTDGRLRPSVQAAGPDATRAPCAPRAW